MRLETRVHHQTEGERRSRAAIAGLAGGATALPLSFFLPWLRGVSARGTRFTEDGVAILPADRSSITGWELMGAALVDSQWSLIFVMAVVLATLAFAVAALFTERGWVFVAVQVAGWSVPPLLLVFGPSGESSVGLGGGVWIASLGAVVTALAALRIRSTWADSL
ncbi:hypothetical protein [Nocardiopsis sp. Huas11]|uniref:hypothetical protein n=1 Tax=Nocardiopsis sp. Huas11 TaxID=2183912 RepID=UPI0011C44015|nr:hypothetical protein [Nocardiopsis sp. Huas11]